MGYIYKIINRVNNKIYIGQTINSIEQRFKQHTSAANNDYAGYLYNAMRKYGIDNFIIEALEENDNILLNERERYYIALFNSTDRNIGYNIDKGGGNGHATHPEHSRYTRPVNKYDLNGNLIKSYNSIKECAKDNNMAPSNISACVQGKFKSWNGFQYKYEEDTPEVITSVRGSKKVNQYDLNDNYIKTFNSAREAGKAVGAKSYSKISECCNGKIKTAYKYKWRYVE